MGEKASFQKWGYPLWKLIVLLIYNILAQYSVEVLSNSLRRW